MTTSEITARVGRIAARPSVALAVFALLTGVLVQTGAFGSVDTARRYQVTRSFWRGEAPVKNGDWPEFGIVGRDGTIQAWYGLGQSLVMLPADIVAAASVGRMGNAELRLKAETAVVAFLTFPLLLVGTSAVAQRVAMRLFAMTEGDAARAVVIWIVGTTVLHYAQVHQENSLDLLLLLTTIAGAIEWERRGSTNGLLVASLATFVNMLVRLPSVIDASLVLAAALVCRCATAGWRADKTTEAVKQLFCVFATAVLAGVVVDRAYQVWRFGWESIGTTYIHLYGIRERLRDPGLPVEFPFSGRFLDGFVGPLIDSTRSIFLFDPLLVPVLVGGLLAARMGLVTRRAAVGAGVLGCVLAARLSEYATYVHWPGGMSWSSRFVLTPVQIGLLAGYPLARLLWPHLSKLTRVGLIVILSASASVQVASVIASPIWANVEAACDGRNRTLLVRQMTNAVKAITHGERIDRRCSSALTEDTTRVQFLPFGNAHELPDRLRIVILGAWLCCAVAWLAVVKLLSGMHLTNERAL